MTAKPPRRAALTRRRSHRGRMPVAVRFLVLLAALSLPLWLLGAFAPIIEVGALDLPASAMMFVLPLVVVATVLRRDVVRLLRRTVAFTGRWHWHLVGTLTPLFVAVTAVGGLWMFRGGEFGAWPVLSLSAAFVLFLIPAAFEELGWAFATDTLLLRWGWIVTGWMLGLVTAAWHLVPLLQAGNGWIWIGAWFVSTVSGRVIKVWFYLKTRGAIPVLIGIHAMDNTCAAMVPGYNMMPGIAAGAAVTVTLAVVLMVTERRTMPVMDELSSNPCHQSHRPD